MSTFILGQMQSRSRDGYAIMENNFGLFSPKKREGTTNFCGIICQTKVEMKSSDRVGIENILIY